MLDIVLNMKEGFARSTKLSKRQMSTFAGMVYIGLFAGCNKELDVKNESQGLVHTITLTFNLGHTLHM